MRKREQLEALIEHYSGGNKSEFARLLNISPQAVSSWIARSQFDVELIYAKCVDVNSEWLLTGEGPMIIDSSIAKEPAPTYGNINNPFYELYKEKDKEVNRLNQEIGALNSEVEYLKKLLRQSNMSSMIDIGVEGAKTSVAG